MEMQWSAEDLDFQTEVRAFLKEKLTPELRRAGHLRTSVYSDRQASMEWQAVLHEKGWAAQNWPVEFGGTGWSVSKRYIFARENAAAGAPGLSPMGIAMVAYAIMGFGTPEQKKFFLPKILTGEHFWCQGYSESRAGSDLASLQMPAVEDGDDFILNGSKIWTTHAGEANWMFCLVRTAQAEKKQNGITFLLVPMDVPGIEVCPITMISGEEIQNEIFFENVRVPKSNVIGEIDQGWSVAKYLLEFERGGTAYAPGLQMKVQALHDFACNTMRGEGELLINDPLFTSQLTALRIRLDALEMLEFRVNSVLSNGENAGVAASMLKVLGTELSQEINHLTYLASGLQGLAYQPHATMPGGPVPSFDAPADGYVSGSEFEAISALVYFNDRAASIYAGSNEIQRNILAKAQLGL